MRVVLLISVLLVMFTACPLNAAMKQHKYHTGIVSFIDAGQVIIDGVAFTLKPEVKFVLITKDSKGARYERRGSQADVSVGNRVYLKAVGSMVYEIVVERY